MKFIKKNIKLIVGILIGMLLVSGISIYATYKYFATDVSYTREGTEMSVADALNELYQNKKETTDSTKEITENGEQTLDKYYKKLNVNVLNDFIPEIVWTNDAPNSDFTGTTLNLDLSQYKYVLIIVKQSTNSTGSRNSAYVLKVENPNATYTEYIRGIGTHYYRSISVWTNSIKISDCTYVKNSTIKNEYSYPLYIYGIKGELDANIVN